MISDVVFKNLPPVTEQRIAINPPMEFDFSSKKDILRQRRAWVNAERLVAPPSYEPLEAVFRRIEDGFPWWGLSGMYGLGAGERSIEGPSKDSRFIANPYLLVALAEPHGWSGSGAPDPAARFYPVPLELVYHTRTAATARYDVGSHFYYIRDHGFAEAELRTLSLIAYNARDFGFGYLAVDVAASRNVRWLAPPPVAAMIRQMIHAGTSCGYKDGCNNMSPEQPELNISVPDLPATAVIKLWRDAPASVGDPADMTFTIEMK